MTKVAHARGPLAANVGCEQRAKSVPPMPDRLVADIDPALEEQVFDIPQAERERTYIMTTRRITSGEEWKYLNGFSDLAWLIAGGYQRPALLARFLLTTPGKGLSNEDADRAIASLEQPLDRDRAAEWIRHFLRGALR